MSQNALIRLSLSIHSLWPEASVYLREKRRNTDTKRIMWPLVLSLFAFVFVIYFYYFIGGAEQKENPVKILIWSNKLKNIHVYLRDYSERTNYRAMHRSFKFFNICVFLSLSNDHKLIKKHCFLYFPLCPSDSWYQIE